MVKALTIEQVKNLKGNETIYLIDYFNADGSPMAYRQSGKVQLWKTRPNDFRIPVKRGMYENGEVVPSNMHTVTLDRPASIDKKNVSKGKQRK